MKTVLICGYIARDNEKEAQSAAIKPLEYSSNNYLRSLISGFQSNDVDFHVLSAPLIGSYPNASKTMRFRGFATPQTECEYVNFNNIWGIRNFFRAKALKKKMKRMLAAWKDEEINLVVCAAHTPFVECAAYAKKLNPKIKTCFVIPDLPQYMHLDGKPGLLYRIAKAADIRRLTKFNRSMDSYVLLTREMSSRIDLHGCPYEVIEGIIPSVMAENRSETVSPRAENTINIVYTGKTYVKFGIMNLVDAFGLIEDSHYRLIICGTGDCDERIRERAKQDARILFQGQIPSDEAKKMIRSADVLVNPRQDNEEYTKYSFPSKNLEYLSSGKAVVLYLLSGMEEIYKDFCFVPNSDSIEDLSYAIVRAATCETVNERYDAFCQYSKGLVALEVCRKILKLMRE